MDFSKYTFRCSMLGYLMSEPKSKSNQEKYYDAIQLKSSKEEELLVMSDKISATEKKISDCTEKAAKTKVKLESDLSKYNLKLDKISDEIEMLEIEIDRLSKIRNIPNLSDTAKAKLSEIYTMETTGRTKNIKNKYMEKGILKEEDAITDYSIFVNKMHEKNKERRYNDYIEGEMDFEDDNDFVNDTKCCWDVFTFDAKAIKKIDPIYDWQGQGYMWLFEKNNFRLIYSLQNTPEKLIEIEEKQLLKYWLGSEDEYKEAVQELRFNHIYDDLPLERKLRIYETKRDEERIAKIKVRVEECRWYLNHLDSITNKKEVQDEQ